MRHKNIKKHKKQNIKLAKQKPCGMGKNYKGNTGEKPLKPAQNIGGLNMSYCRMCVTEIIGFREIWSALHIWLGADSHLADRDFTNGSEQRRHSEITARDGQHYKPA